MLAAFLTAIFFAFSAIFASRSARLIGGTTANLGRMIIALLILGIWSHVFGSGLEEKTFPYFFLSGFIGFGLGDVAFFLALSRIGPRLSVLLAQCLAAPFAILIERIWLGTTLRGIELCWGLIILLGVAVALAPTRDIAFKRNALWIGAFFGILTALGQATGAVISRKGDQMAELAGLNIDGGTAAYERTIGALLITAIAYVIAKIWNRPRKFNVEFDKESASRWRRAWPSVVLNGLTGPGIGVGCYQWALSTTPSGIVLPIVAITPALTIPLVFLMEGERPSALSIFGGIIAVTGAIALAVV